MRAATSGAEPVRALRRLISGRATIPVPGAFSPSVALLAKKVGFKAVYFSGAAFSNVLGLPDLGVTTMVEVSEAVNRITSRVDLPLIVDIDTGFGEAVNLERTVFEMERANAAAIQIEDQVMPKRCGHLAGKQLVETQEMVKKVIAAKEARRRGIVIIARTDAAGVEGFDSAVERARLYVRTGAEVVFPEALKTTEEFREFARKVDVPLLANMTEFGQTPYLTVAEFQLLGYRLVIFPVTAFRVMMKSVLDAFGELARTGTQKGLLKRMMTRSELYELIGYDSFERTDERLANRALRLLDTD